MVKLNLFNNHGEEQKLSRQRNKALKAKTAETAIDSAPWLDKPAFLYRWWKRLNDQQKRELLVKAWVGCNLPRMWTYENWLNLFDETGYITDCDIQRPDEEITLYRGCDEGHQLGMSWTPDLEAAQWFRDRHNPNGTAKVYKTVVQPDWVLMTLEGFAGETRNIYVFEYVIDSRKLSVENVHVRQQRKGV